MMIRGHLWVEVCMNRMLTLEMAAPTAVDLDRMTWRAKLDLCQALGRVGADEVGLFRRLNSLRNRLAHQVDAEITDRDVDELFEASAGMFRTGLVSQHVERPDHVRGRLYRVFFASVMILEHRNDRRQWELDNKAAIDAFHLGMALYDLQGITYDPKEMRMRFDFPDPPDPHDVWVEYPKENNEIFRRYFGDGDGDDAKSAQASLS